MTISTEDLAGLTRSATDAPRSNTKIEPPARRWRTRVLLPILVLTVVVLLLATAADAILPATAVRVVPVVVRAVEGSAGSVTVQAPGWLEPDPHPQYVTALADGIVQEILVLEGERVEAGQPIARLVEDDARLALRRTQAQLAGREAELASAQADAIAATLRLRHLIERSRALAVAESDVAEAEAQIIKSEADTAMERARLLELRDELGRKEKLTESQAVSEASVARLRLRVEAQGAMVDGVVARTAVLRAQRDEAKAELAAARTDRDLLIDEERAVGLTSAAVAAAEAAVTLAAVSRDEAALRLERMLVRSPISGVIMRRLASPGSKLTLNGSEQSAQVAHVYDPAHLQVRVDVPLADAAQVAIGQEVVITVEVLPDQRFAGRVTRMLHQADIQKNTVEVKVAVTDPVPELKPDMLARVKFLARDDTPAGGSVRQRLFAPSRLITSDADGSASVLAVAGLVDGRGRVERRIVVVGERKIDGWVEIDEGLRVGDLLVAQPPPDMEPGDRVRVAGEANDANGGGERP